VNGNIKRLVATSLATAMLAVSMIAPAVSAAPPDWAMDVTVLSPEVKSGNSAGFEVTIRNNGTSNIAQLYLVSNLTATPTYTEAPCNATGRLYCYFGALPAGGSVTVTVGYLVPAGSTSFAPEFQANTNGATDADNKGGKKGTSRGDTLIGVYTPPTINNSANFGGGWTAETAQISNATGLADGNPQSTQLSNLASLIPATVRDGFAEDLCGTACSRSQFGEVSEVHVENGANQDQAFRITITIRGRSLGTPKPDASSVVVIHELDDEDAPVEIIGDVPSERCDSATSPTSVTGQGCVIATWVGNGANANLQIVVWTFYNGKFRGSV
jgi:hypothetical protein